MIDKNIMLPGKKLFELKENNDFEPIFVRKVGTKYIYLARTEKNVKKEEQRDWCKVPIGEINKKFYVSRYQNKPTVFTNPLIYFTTVDLYKMADELHKTFGNPFKLRALGHEKLKKLYRELIDDKED